ncbi:cyanophycin synthetase [Desnuesiella massiliensis]|uniref:cyanophycin synthetase n=1 Tax=Desnuesiella massiliensis TaxID=1650662 RepID=UPI0006E1673E|nr:cyanophycin synthetase [Desnuesiella massiliensis]
MKIINYRAFEGRNIYSHRKCIRLDVDLEGYSNIPSNKISYFTENLVNLIPELKKHRCGIDEDQGFVKRLKEGTYLAHICEHIIIALHNMINLDISYGKAREVSEEIYYLIFEYKYQKTAMAIARLSIDIINSLIMNRCINIDNRLNEIKKMLNNELIGPSTEAICNAAKRKGIPIIHINEHGIFQLGYGKYGKLIEATIGDNTKAIAVDIACDKLLTKKLLSSQCIPVAKGAKINNCLDLLIQSEAIGYPIVLKPQFGNQGKGVFLDIKNEKEALRIYKELRNNFKDIMVERYVQGNDYRVCVIDGEVIAVALRVPPSITGDGIRSVKELIKEFNEDSRRGEGHEKPLTKVKFNNELINSINSKGYSLNSILEKDKKLILRENANLSTGGMAIDCTDNICKENIDICKRAAKIVGLNICGIDICCEDISKPIKDSGVIVEINAAPGIRMHHYPSSGKERDVAGAIVDMMFKNSPKNIPVISITGTNGKTTTTRLIAHVLSMIGYNVGMTTTGGIYIDKQCIDKGDTTGFESALTVLLNKEVDVAVLETARGGIIKNGLGYDLADVGVITNITEDHLGLDGIETLEELSHVKSLIVEAVKAEGYSVLNADDPCSMSIIERAKGKLILFSKDRNNKYLQESLSNGGYGVYIYNDSIYVEKEKRIYHIANIREIPITFNGILEYNVENSLAACAALVGLEVDYCIISKGIKSFLSNEDHNPGRFNLYDLDGVKVILDYGHNIEGYKAVISGAKRMSYKNLIGVIGVPGDRLDENIIQLGQISGENFNKLYIKEDKDKRGRKTGEVANLLKSGVLKCGKEEASAEIILDEVEALSQAIDNASKEDLIIVFFEDYEPLLRLIKSKIDSKNIKEELA